MANKYTTLSQEAIELICSLLRESHSIAEGINDSAVSDVTTFSSHRIQVLMDALSEEDRKYTEDLVGNLKRLVTEVVDVIPTVGNAKVNTLYLYKAADDTGNSYTQYMLIGDQIVTLGTTDVNLDGYYTSEQVDNKFATKTDLSGVVDTIGDTTALSTDAKILVDAINEIKDAFDSIAAEDVKYDETRNVKDIVDEIVDGVTTVGNANNLKYKTYSSVDLFATAEDITICPPNTITPLRLYQPTNAPVGNSDFFVQVHKENSGNYIKVIALNMVDGKEYQILKTATGWKAWVDKSGADTLDGFTSEDFAKTEQFSTQGDFTWMQCKDDANNLAYRLQVHSGEVQFWESADGGNTWLKKATLNKNYLPLTGGEINGSIWVNTRNSSDVQVSVENTLRKVSNSIGEDGRYFLYDGTNNKTIIESSANGNTNVFNGTSTGNLPLTGGKISSVGANNAPLRINSGHPSDSRVLQGYFVRDIPQGYIGFRDENVPVFQGTDTIVRDIIHTGNLSTAIDENSTDKEAPSAKAVYGSLDELPKFIYDETGRIIGYTTKVGGADSVFPFSNNGNSNYIYLIKDGVAQSGTGVNFNISNLTQYDGYLQPTTSTVASGKVNMLALDMSNYACAVADVSTSSSSSTTYTYWYTDNANDSTASRLSFEERGYTGTKDIMFACRDNTCRLHNLYLIPKNN